MYMRKIMVGKMFAGGCVSSFHLTSLARHSVHRPPRRWLEGLDSLRWLQVGLSRPVNPNTDVRRAAGLPGLVALLLFLLMPARRASFLRPISPELLEIGPEVCDVLVVLDADKCHARARHFLHRRADIFGESFLAPGDARRFVSWRVVETLEGAALAAIEPLSGGPSLILASCPISWQGEHNRLNTCSPAAASCPNVGPVEAATANPAITHVLSISSPL